MESLNQLSVPGQPGRTPTLFESVTSAQPAPIPPKPVALLDIERMPPGLSKIKNMEEYQKSLEYQKYTDVRWKANLHNQDAVLWLVEYLKNCSPSIEQKAAIENKLRQFLRHMGDQRDVFIALRLSYKKLGIQHLEVRID